MKASRKHTVAALVPMALALAGCSVTRPEVAIPVELPPSFSIPGATREPVRWWTTFNDATLDRLVEEALAGNFSVLAAWDRLAEAEQTARIAGAELFPSLDVSGSGGGRFERSGGDTSSSGEFRIGVAAAYEIDLWGRIRSRRDAARADAEARAEDVMAAAITVSAAVAQAWYELAEARQQERVISDQVSTNERVLEALVIRFRHGQAGAADVFRQRQLVENTRGNLIVAEARTRTLEHAVAVLVGRAPGAQLPYADAALVEPPALPQTGIPVELVHTRPDVRSAYLAVQAEDQRVAEAIADRLPRLSITANGDTTADNVRDLFANGLANVAGNLVQPVIDGGRRRAEVDRRRARVSQAVHFYGQAVLDTIREVEDALVRESRQRDLIESLRKQLATAETVIERTRDSYAKGQLDYLRVLDALTSRQRLERDYVTALRQQLTFRIDLARALATGWTLERPALAQAEAPRASETP
jgi:NodT family efflux transporter outer membrane factor (OMF) lipoprotein